jgi:hypothetical protein
VISYDENKSIEFGVGINEANAEFKQIHGTDIPYDPGMISVHSERAAWDYYVGGLPWDGPNGSKIKHLNEYRDVYSLPHVAPGPTPVPGPVPPFPAVPTRDRKANINIGFQGEMVDTKEFGRIPVFGPETTTLSDEDLHSYCQQLGDQNAPLGKGYSHAEIALSWQYDEHDYHYPVPGRDLSQNLDELARRIRIMIHYFSGGVLLHLAGDGRSNPPERGVEHSYNDPQGWTYGFEWLMGNLSRIVKGLKGSAYGDVTPWIEYCPGYDAVFYGWGNIAGEGGDGQPDRVVEYGNYLRSLDPDCVSTIEFTPGNIPVGGGPRDMQTRLQVFDVFLAEYRADYPYHDGDEWQVNARMVKPYHRPADQQQHVNNGPSDPLYPAANDTGATLYLAMTPRGMQVFVSYERNTYLWVRQRISRADVAADAQYHRDMGVANVCFIN